MTELERKALMGDKEAQRICTEQGVVLPCPKCFKPVKVKESIDKIKSFDCECGLSFRPTSWEGTTKLSTHMEHPPRSANWKM